MKLTRHEVGQIIQDLKPNRFTLPDYVTLSKYIAENTLSVVESTTFQEVVQYELKEYKRLGKKYGDDRFVIDTDDFVFEVFSQNDNDEEQEVNPQPQPPPKSYKPLHNVSRRQILRRTDELWQGVKSLSEKENVKASQIIGLLLTRCVEKDVVDIGTSLWENNVKPPQVSIDKAIAIYTGSRLGRDTYTDQKKLLDSDGHYVLPPWKHIRKQQMDITPDFQELPAPHNGVYFPLLSAVTITFQRLLTHVTIESGALPKLFKMKIKFGFDGSGNHSIYNQINNVQTNNIIMTMFCPLSIETDDGSTVWTRDSPNNPFAQRPVGIQLGKESADNITSLAIFNEDMAKMQEGIDLGSSQVKVDISSYMMDRKAADLYLGTGGGYCDLCTLTKEACHCIDIVKNYVNIDREITNLHDIFERLVQDDGTILKERGDYAVRQGLTNKPVATIQAPTVQVLHALLRTFDFFMKIVVHTKAGVFDWSEGVSHSSKFLAAAKVALQGQIQEGTGIKWDVVDKTGKGGTTTTGNVARRLLHSKASRDLIVSSLPDDHRDKISFLGQQLSTILRVMSSKEKVNVDKYKNLCYSVYIFLLQKFQSQTKQCSWVSITPTVHKLLAHSWELIDSNDGYGLGSLDESGLEGCNKLLRNVRTCIARKTSQKDNVVDTIRRLWLSSDPLVQVERKKARNVCKVCLREGHTLRSCPLDKATVSTEDDTLFHDLLVSEMEN